MEDKLKWILLSIFLLTVVVLGFILIYFYPAVMSN